MTTTNIASPLPLPAPADDKFRALPDLKLDAVDGGITPVLICAGALVGGFFFGFGVTHFIMAVA